jgi:hypothetical protein
MEITEFLGPNSVLTHVLIVFRFKFSFDPCTHLLTFIYFLDLFISPEKSF